MLIECDEVILLIIIHFPYKELDRLGVNQKQWRVTEANQHFLLCDRLLIILYILPSLQYIQYSLSIPYSILYNYHLFFHFSPHSLPPYIVVPYNISDDTLEYAAGLHFKNRLPVSHTHSLITLLLLLLIGRCGVGVTVSLVYH